MRTLRSLLVLVTALAATAAFAGPRGKTTVPPSGSSSAAKSATVMVEKSGKRTTAVPCDGATEKCKAHCAR